MTKHTLLVSIASSSPFPDLARTIRDGLAYLGEDASPSVGHDNFGDVRAFHEKFGVPESPGPALLDFRAKNFRTKFMQEELDEFCEACLDQDIEKAFDALLDLVYVALGTAAMMGLPWQEGWQRVQSANMAKVRARRDGSDSKRGSSLDVVKPIGWQPPHHGPVLKAAGLDFSRPVPVFRTDAVPADSEGGEV